MIELNKDYFKKSRPTVPDSYENSVMILEYDLKFKVNSKWKITVAVSTSRIKIKWEHELYHLVHNLCSLEHRSLIFSPELDREDQEDGSSPPTPFAFLVNTPSPSDVPGQVSVLLIPFRRIMGHSKACSAIISPHYFGIPIRNSKMSILLWAFKPLSRIMMIMMMLHACTHYKVSRLLQGNKPSLFSRSDGNARESIKTHFEIIAFKDSDVKLSCFSILRLNKTYTIWTSKFWTC